MLRVLLVDDDVVIRTNLKTMIEWEQHGFIVADEVMNGVECIQKLSMSHFDLVITDMYMPIMGGVALVESICQYFPGVEVLAISGYDDYNYIRDSLKKGAVDYVLKHTLNKEILCEVLETVKNKLIEKNKLLYHSNMQLEQLSEGRILILHNLVQEILAGRISYKETKQRIEFLEISCEFTNLILCCMKVQNFSTLGHGKADLVIKSFIDVVDKIITEDFRGFAAYLEEGHFVAFIDFGKINSTLSIHQMLAEILSRICSTSKKFLGLHITIAVSSLCGSYEKIPEFFYITKKSLENKFYDEQQLIWQHNELPKEETQISLNIKDEEHIMRFLEEGDKDGMINFLASLFDKCKKINASVRAVQVICAELISFAIQFCIQHSLESTRVELVELQLSGAYVKKEFIELRMLISQIYEKVLAEYTSVMEESGRNPYVIRAIQYINSNYRNNISLTDTAEYVGVSAQYLSHLINEECKKGFAELLNGKRVEVVCEMMRSHNYKVKEIVEKAGFNNYNYFFKVFKDVTGLTPVEYERQEVCKQALERRKVCLSHDWVNK